MAVADKPLPLQANVLSTHRMCLQEGRYQFAIYDLGGDGICCVYGEGGYSIASGGNIIVQGGDFGRNETTLFDVPFTPTE